MLPANLRALAKPFHDLNRPMLLWANEYVIMVYPGGIVVVPNKTSARLSPSIGHKVAKHIGLQDYAVALHNNKVAVIPTGGINVIQS